MLKRLLVIIALAMVLGQGFVSLTQAQGDCQLYQDNHLCYDGSVGCDFPAAGYSSAGQSSVVTQYSCSVATVAYLGVCDSGNEPQDDQFILDINGQIVSENVIDATSEYVRIYPITLGAGVYPLNLSVLRDTSPPGTYRIVAATTPGEIESQLGTVCGTDFAATTFEEEGAGRLITEPLPIVAFASYRRDDNGDGLINNQDGAGLYLYDAYRDIEVPLAPDHHNFDPAWSPDGRTIVFVSEGRATGDQAALFTVPASGGIPQPLTDGSVTYWHPEYSPTGLDIAATCGRNSICLMNADGSNLRTILASDGANAFYWDPQWSPDGSQLLVLGRTEDTNGSGHVDGCDQSALFVMNRDGSGLRRITYGSQYIFGGDWSGDGSRIIYYAAWETGNGHACAYNDEAALGIVDRSTGVDSTVIPRGRFLRTPAFSNDMSFATFTAPNNDNNEDGFLDARDRESLVVFIFADGTQRRLTMGEYEVFDPAWAPSHVTALP